jgi:hypothetical protein
MMTDDFSLTRDDDYSTDYSLAPVSEIEIKRLENSLGLAFPASYRKFLAHYNGGSFKECVFPESEIGPLIVVSFFSANGANGDPVDVAIRNMREYLPFSCIPFAEDPGGNLFYIDTADGDRVFFWEHETRDRYFLSESFQAFVNHLALDA